MNPARSPLTVARACLRAYVDKDRAAIESILADDYHFTSPIDNALDRMTYLKRCWPNSKMMEAFDYIYGAEFGDHALIGPTSVHFKGEIDDARPKPIFFATACRNATTCFSFE